MHCVVRRSYTYIFASDDAVTMHDVFKTCQVSRSELKSVRLDVTGDLDGDLAHVKVILSSSHHLF